jgi:hypothetical protein
MKNLNFIAAVLGILLVLNLSACKETQENKQVEETSVKETQTGENSHNEDLKFSNETSEHIFNAYLKVKDAMVASDLKAVNKNAEELNKTLDQNLESVTNIVNAKSLDEARSQMLQLSDEVEELVSSSILEGAIYKQYCPMALNNTGGYWLASEEKIHNPYFGNKMLKCGKVTSTIQ